MNVFASLKYKPIRLPPLAACIGSKLDQAAAVLKSASAGVNVSVKRLSAEIGRQFGRAVDENLAMQNMRYFFPFVREFSLHFMHQAIFQNLGKNSVLGSKNKVLGLGICNNFFIYASNYVQRHFYWRLHFFSG